MIRDRGKIKWTSMMLPEHVTLLREWAKEDSFESEKELDEQQIEAINRTILEAMELAEPVIIKQYRTDLKEYKLIEGHIHYCNHHAQKLHLVDVHGELRYIPYEELVDIRLKNEQE